MSRASGGASSLASRLRKWPGMPSGPVDLSGLMFCSVLRTQRVRTSRKRDWRGGSVVCCVALSWTSGGFVGGGGSRLLEVKVVARRLALACGSWTQVLSVSRRGGMPLVLERLLSSCRL